MPQSVALVGSSGGGAATLGQHNVAALVDALASELQSANLSLDYVVLIACEHPLDLATPTSAVQLFVRMPSADSATAALECVASDTLQYINTEALPHFDQALATAIEAGGIAALITVSCDPVRANAQTVAAALRRRLPITGTGGSSIAALAARGARLVGSPGGSVATTHASRAVAATAGLAAALGEGHVYWPRRGQWGISRLRSALDGCLPLILAPVAATALCRLGAWSWQQGCAWTTRPGVTTFAALRAPWLQEALTPLAAWFRSPWASAASELEAPQFAKLMALAAPIGVAVVGVHNLAEDMGEMGILAAALASATAQGELLAGLGAAALVSLGLPHALSTASRLGLPATAATLASVGTVGTLAAVVTGAVFAPVSRGVQATLGGLVSLLTDHSVLMRAALTPDAATALSWLRARTVGGPELADRLLCATAGAAVGMGVCRAAEVGWYHGLVLPLLLLEMQGSRPALLGAHDLCALCMTGAGVCAGAYLASVLGPSERATAESAGADDIGLQHRQGERALARRGVLTNLLCGDFIEAAYPFSTADVWVKRSVYAGAAVAGAILHLGAVKSTAYVPVPLALAASNRPQLCALACATAFGLPLGVTFTRRLWLK